MTKDQDFQGFFGHGLLQSYVGRGIGNGRQGNTLTCASQLSQGNAVKRASLMLKDPTKNLEKIRRGHGKGKNRAAPRSARRLVSLGSTSGTYLFAGLNLADNLA